MPVETLPQPGALPQPAAVPAKPSAAPAQTTAERKPVHVSGKHLPDFDCQLIGLDSGFIHLRSDIQVPEAVPLVVAFDQVQLNGHVAQCVRTGGAWKITVALSDRKQRMEDRVPSGQRCSLRVIGSKGSTAIQGFVADQSKGGLGVKVSQPIEKGLRVCVETKGTVLFGEVRNCRPQPDGRFIAGILVVEVAKDRTHQNAFSVMLSNLRWKLASGIRGR